MESPTSNNISDVNFFSSRELSIVALFEFRDSAERGLRLTIQRGEFVFSPRVENADQRDDKEDAANDGSRNAEETSDPPGERNAYQRSENSEIVVHGHLRSVDFKVKIMPYLNNSSIYRKDFPIFFNFACPDFALAAEITGKQKSLNTEE